MALLTVWSNLPYFWSSKKRWTKFRRKIFRKSRIFGGSNATSWLGSTHKLCYLKGVKNCQLYLVKRQLRGGMGSKITDFETVYGRPFIGKKVHFLGPNTSWDYPTCTIVGFPNSQDLIFLSIYNIDKFAIKILEFPGIIWFPKAFLAY